MDGSAEIRRKCPKSRLFSLGFRARLTEKVLSDNVLLDAAMRKRVLETTTGPRGPFFWLRLAARPRLPIPPEKPPFTQRATV